MAVATRFYPRYFIQSFPDNSATRRDQELYYSWEQVLNIIEALHKSYNVTHSKVRTACNDQAYPCLEIEP